MEVKPTSYDEVKELSHLKLDLVDKYATYFGAYISEKLVGIVAYVEHDDYIYLCHDFILEEHRNKGIYKVLSNYREMKLLGKNKTIIAHCNTNSLKNFINNGYEIEKTLFKVKKLS